MGMDYRYACRAESLLSRWWAELRGSLLWTLILFVIVWVALAIFMAITGPFKVETIG